MHSSQAQMISHLGLQRSFQNRFGQLFEQTVLPDDILGLLVVGEQLIDQLLVDGHGVSYFLPPVIFGKPASDHYESLGRVLLQALKISLLSASCSRFAERFPGFRDSTTNCFKYHY
jgi:hypothetical protein